MFSTPTAFCAAIAVDSRGILAAAIVLPAERRNMAPTPPFGRIGPGEVLVIPDVAASLVLASMDLLIGPSWDDWVDVLRAQDRMRQLALVCRAWRAPAVRFARSIWFADSRSPPADGALVRTIVITHRSPWNDGLAAFQQLIDQCPNATALYSHKPPFGLRLPASCTALYATGLDARFLQGGLRQPQLRALSVVQLNDSPLSGYGASHSDLTSLIGSIGCGLALQCLTIDLTDLVSPRPNDESSRPRTLLLSVLTESAPNLAVLSFTPELVRGDSVVRA